MIFFLCKKIKEFTVCFFVYFFMKWKKCTMRGKISKLERRKDGTNYGAFGYSGCIP